MSRSTDDTAADPHANRLKRRAILHGATAASAAALLAAATQVAKAAEAGPYPAHPRWKFVFVNHVTTNPFFVPTQYGIADACAFLGCTYQWTGSEICNAAEMVNAMNIAIAGKADGIATCLVDPKAFNAPTERALAAGIPVFAYNADAPLAVRQQAARLYRAGSLPGRLSGWGSAFRTWSSPARSRCSSRRRVSSTSSRGSTAR